MVSASRKKLAKLLRNSPQIFRAEDAMAALDLNKRQATQLLAHWHNQGRIRRVARGKYTSLPPTAIDQEQVLEDPWILVPALFESGYIGGWTAAEHWDLTEQLFSSICVLTPERLGRQGTERQYQGVRFSVIHVSQKAMFGLQTLWRGQVKLSISDPHKTILDMLLNPVVGGGIEHVIDCCREYFRQQSAKAATLIDYADRLGNGTVIKRLGYIAESLAVGDDFLNECRARLPTGYSPIDPALPRDRLITRWGLWVPAYMERSLSDSPR